MRVLLGLSRFYSFTLDYIHLNHLTSLGVIYRLALLHLMSVVLFQ